MVIVSVSSFHSQPVRIRANDDIEFVKRKRGKRKRKETSLWTAEDTEQRHGGDRVESNS